METKNQTAQESAQSGVVDYAAALRQYHRYGRGRSMEKFCEDEGYDYWKFCKLAISEARALRWTTPIESCKHNEIDPGKYISYLLGKLKTAQEGEDLTALLPCYCSL